MRKKLGTGSSKSSEMLRTQPKHFHLCPLTFIAQVTTMSAIYLQFNKIVWDMENFISMLNIDEGYTYLRMTEDGLNFSRLCCWDTLRGRHFHVQEIK